MFYDMRTYTLKPGRVAEVEKLFAEALPTREKYSRLGAFFHSDIGVLNQVVHIWPYDDLEEMQRARVDSSADPSGQWPPVGLADHLVTMESEIVQSTPFMEDWTGPKAMGNIYELRTYSLLPGCVREVVKIWGEHIADRVPFSPLGGCWVPAGSGGTQNKLYHLWPYADLNERVKARNEARASGKWPPPSGQFYTRQESKILVPASFSPMH
jgi:hypothetical protein